jgi:hypothetical protein
VHPIDVSINQVPLSGLRIGADIILPSSTAVRDLGIHLDTDVGMRFHVSQLESGCFAVLRQLRSIRPSVTRPVFVSLVVSLVLSRLESQLRKCHVRWHHGTVDWQITTRCQRRCTADQRVE